MKDKILVVGGYGNVGQIICRDLGEIFPGKVIAAGRNYEKAKMFTQTTNNSVIPLELDVFVNQDKNQILEEVLVVVMCLDQEDTKFVETCLKQGVNYIDITASYSFLSKIELLNNIAKEAGTTCILSVGLSPGLTNLLVKYSKSHFDTLDSADISLMLGLGDEHGKAAIEWMMDNINTKFNVHKNGKLEIVKSFEDGKKTTLPENLGERTAYRFDFAEQHVLPKSLNINNVSNRICFDSRFITKLVAVLKKVGYFNLMKIKMFKNIAIKVFGKVHLGSDVFVAKVDALGKKDGQIKEFECSVMGKSDSIITGKVAAVITEFTYTNKYALGIYHIEQIFDLSDIKDKLSEYISFYSD